MVLAGVLHEGANVGLDRMLVFFFLIYMKYIQGITAIRWSKIRSGET